MLVIFFLSRIFTTTRNQLLKLHNSIHNYTITQLHKSIIKTVVVKTHIHAHKNNNNNKKIIIKKGNANLPSQGKSIPTTPQMEVPTPTIKESDP